MAKIQFTPVNVQTGTIEVKYILHIPAGIWIFDELVEGAFSYAKWPPGAYLTSTDQIYVPIDLMTAARLHLIKPGDDSGVGDLQWAWISLFTATEEKK